MKENEEKKPLTKEAIEALNKKLYDGELRDLAHLKEMPDLKQINQQLREQHKYIDIQNPIAKEIHDLLCDNRYSIHEINRDTKHLDSGWIGYLSPPLPKHVCYAATDGSGVFQILKGLIRSHLKVGEFVFIRRVGDRNVF